MVGGGSPSTNMDFHVLQPLTLCFFLLAGTPRQFNIELAMSQETFPLGQARTFLL